MCYDGSITEELVQDWIEEMKGRRRSEPRWKPD